jgi:hypothetical protein
LTKIVDGIPTSKAIGTVPAFSEELRMRIERVHEPGKIQFINDTINHTSVILAWMHGRIDAVCFLSEENARAYPGFMELPEACRIGGCFSHFP